MRISPRTPALLCALVLAAAAPLAAHATETLPPGWENLFGQPSAAAPPADGPGEKNANAPDISDDTSITTAQSLISQGMEYLGIRYRFGGTSPETGLDCSGLVRNVFRNALGLDLPRTAREMSSLGDRVTRQDLKPGDLVFFNTMRRAFSHVGIYVGDGQFLHSATRGGGVRIGDLSDRYWSRRFSGARRLLDENTASGS